MALAEMQQHEPVEAQSGASKRSIAELINIIDREGILEAKARAKTTGRPPSALR
jgi:hypothetical protein